jgi:Zn-dependent oligopeptidase
VRPEHFPGAFEAALAEHRAEIAAIVAGQEPATFANTIAALERSGAMRDRVERLFAVARENITSPEFQALEREWQPKLAAATDEIFLNGGLFQRIASVHGSLENARLAADEKRLATCWRTRTPGPCSRAKRTLPGSRPPSSKRRRPAPRSAGLPPDGSSSTRDPASIRS